eukprot:1861440-Alexandrium_andersonii.AAC.1
MADTNAGKEPKQPQKKEKASVQAGAAKQEKNDQPVKKKTKGVLKRPASSALEVLDGQRRGIDRLISFGLEIVVVVVVSQ